MVLQLTVSAGQGAAFGAIELQRLLRVLFAHLELLLSSRLQSLTGLLRRQYLMILSNFDSLVSGNASSAKPLFAVLAVTAGMERNCETRVQ